MKKHFFALCLLAVILIWSAPLSAERVTWYQPDFPPYVILDGPNSAVGIDNSIVEYVSTHLPEYSHTHETANYRRILNNLQTRKHGVVTPLFKTPERQEYVHYSDIPSYFVFSNGFIFRKEDKAKYAPYILNDGTLDLHAVCQSQEFTIGIHLGRSYYGIIDKTIQNHGKQAFFTRAMTDHLGLFTMVAKHRLDAAFGFPVEIKYAGLSDSLSFLPIHNMVDMTPVFFGAPKSTFGYTIIEKLNKLTSQQKTLDIFAGYYMYWLPEELRSEYKTRCKAHYQNYQIN